MAPQGLMPWRPPRTERTQESATAPPPRTNTHRPCRLPRTPRFLRLAGRRNMAVAMVRSAENVYTLIFDGNVFGLHHYDRMEQPRVGGDKVRAGVVALLTVVVSLRSRTRHPPSRGS
jgi:hypothetical protein